MSSSRISGLYKLGVSDRIAELERLGWLSRQQADDLSAGRHVLAPKMADKILENVVGVFALPFAIAPNFRINGRDCMVPLVVEEPSIVAALSNAALLARESGGFTASCKESLLAGQIHLVDAAPEAAANLLAARDELLQLANEVHPRLAGRGGGARDIEVHPQLLPDGDTVLAVHVLVDTCDAMGANLVNTICEAIAPRIEAISGGYAALRILSNLADRSVFTASAIYPPARLATASMSGEAVRDAIVLANDIALADPHRAATHNKGIMNGIDPLAIATGNDWRAIEAGAHAFAAQSGRYRALTTWTVAENGDLNGKIQLPLKVGTVGGTLASNPAAALGLALTGAKSAPDLANLMAAVGLAQNFAAIRALATNGIQEGHMRLHARSLAAAAGAKDIEQVAEQLVASGEVKDWKARDIVARGGRSALPADAASAAGKIILLGEHAVVYGEDALALPIPAAVRAAAAAADTTTVQVLEWGLDEVVDGLDDTVTSALVTRVLKGLGCEDRHFSIRVSSALPRGKGLGSSAAFAVAVTRAIAKEAGIDVNDEAVNAIAFECEKFMHGTPSGIDNTVSCFGEALLYRRDNAMEASTLSLPELPPLVVGIAHGTGATDDMLAGVRERRERAAAEYDAIFAQIGTLSRQAAAALGAADFDTLGRYMNLCQGLLNAIGVSTPELEHMIGVARDNGAIGAKLTGAGGGGAIVVLCPGARDRVRSALNAAGYDTLDSPPVIPEQHT